MITFGGIFFFREEAAGTRDVESLGLAFPVTPPERQRLRHGRFELVWTGSQEGEGLIAEDERYVLAVEGRLDSNPLTARSVPGLRTELLTERPAELRGEFALILYDKLTGKLRLYRDQPGTRPFYYLLTGSYIAFSNDMAVLRSLPGFRYEMDEQWIADAISTIKSEKWRTPYTGIKRIPPAHILIADKDVSITPYWDLDRIPEHCSISYNEAVEEFRLRLQTAVNRRVSGAQIAGSELSGGLDSSGITALAKEYADKNGVPFFAFSHGFDGPLPAPWFPYSDERRFFQALCNFVDLKDHLVCDPGERGLLDSLERNILIQSGPVQQNFSLFSDILFEEAAGQGVTQLLSGFGGDEGVSSRVSGFFEEMAGRGEWARFRQEYVLQARLLGRSSISTGLKYFLRRYLPFSAAFAARLRQKDSWKVEKFDGLGFDKYFGERMRIKERFFAGKGFPDEKDVRLRQYNRIMHNHVSQRFEYSYHAARAAGIGYAYPLWDLDLLQFYFALPAEFKFRNGMGRALYRDALKGIIPEELRLRNDLSGTTVPTIQKRFLNDYDAITGLIKRSREANRFHYLDYDRLLVWQERIRDRTMKDRIPSNTSAFFTSLQILLLQEMEREGRYRSGIAV